SRIHEVHCHRRCPHCLGLVCHRCLLLLRIFDRLVPPRKHLLHPQPPKVGQNLCITLNGSLSKPVTTGSQIRVTATFWGINVYDQTADLCAGLVGGANPCPIATTTTTVTQCITVPSNVPAGVSLTLKAVATNADASRIFCINGPLTFSN
ncbi:Phosphatidylglycerol/phosphatidylinositol transfer protein, partial [Linnemannia elongata]